MVMAIAAGGDGGEVGLSEKTGQQGRVVIHQRFGAGTIQTRNGDIATIYFETAGEKKMNLAVCVENGVIK